MNELLIPMQALAASVLKNYEHYEWTVQGFGMIRTYLDVAKRWRFNVWDDRLMVPNVSLIHDHPWSFTSYVVSGQIINQRYMVREGERSISIGPLVTHEFHIIRTGEEWDGTSVLGDAKRLVPAPPEVYGPGDSYKQDLLEVHKTKPLRGTITINERSPPTPEHTARVFWPVGEKWVDAKPRGVTRGELLPILETAINELIAS